jgi:beta-mannosidase
MSWGDYRKLFDRLLPEVVKQHDPDTAYWPCSPHSPRGDRKLFNCDRWGDAHLWDVWFRGKPFEWFHSCRHRFVSEFGFQSFPEPKTVRAFTQPADRNLSSPVMDHHQRSGPGNKTIVSYLADRFRFPKDFESFLWMTQLSHGLAIQTGVEHWRRNMPRTMGALYWQLNDCWPAASWSSIDYFGRWKALQHLARRFYAPLLVSGAANLEKQEVAVHVTSDLLKPCRARLSWRLTDLDGATLAHRSRSLRAPPCRSFRAETLRISRLVEDFDPRRILVWLELEAQGCLVSSNLVLLAYPKKLELRDPKLAATVREESRGRFSVTLRGARPALWCWLELSRADASFSDNFFHVPPRRAVTVTVEPAAEMGKREFERQLRVRSLRDTY